MTGARSWLLAGWLACGGAPPAVAPAPPPPAARAPTCTPAELDAAAALGTVPALRELVARCPAAIASQRVAAAIVAVVLDPRHAQPLSAGGGTAPAGEPAAELALAALVTGDPLVLARLGASYEAAGDVERGDAAYAQALAIAQLRDPGAAVVPALPPRPESMTIWSLVFSPDGTALAQSIAYPRSLTVWNLVGDPRVLPELSNPQWLGPSTLGGITVDTVELWDTDRGTLVKKSARTPGAAPPDGAWLITGQTLQLASTPRVIAIRGNPDRATVAMSADKQRLALADDSGLALWNAATVALERTVTAQKPGQVQFVDAANKLVFTTAAGITAHDLVANTTTRLVAGNNFAVWRGTQVIAAGEGKLEIVELATGKQLGTIAEARSIRGLAVGDRVIAGIADDAVVLWELATRKPLATLHKLPNRGRDDDWLILAADGRVDGSPDMRAKLTWKIGNVTLPGAVAWKAKRTSGLWQKLVAP